MIQVTQEQASSIKVEQLSATYQLGTFQQEFGVKLTKMTLLCGIIVLAAAGGFGFFSYTLLTSPSSVNDLNNAPFGIGIAVLLLVASLYFFLYPVLYRSWHVYIYSEGFAFTRGNKLDAFRWEQVESMWQRVTKQYMNGIYTGTQHKYTIRGLDGRQVVLNDRITNVGKAGKIIGDMVTRVKLPAVIAAYKAGSAVNFGQLGVSMQGVSNGKEWISWDQIKDIQINNGVVTVKKEGKWLSWSAIRVADIPNIFIFFALVRAIMKQAI